MSEIKHWKCLRRKMKEMDNYLKLFDYLTLLERVDVHERKIFLEKWLRLCPSKHLEELLQVKPPLA